MEVVKVALQSGSVSLTAEGREEFVKEVLGMWKELSSIPSKLTASQLATEQKVDQQKANGYPSDSDSKISQYENVYDKVDGKLKIIGHMPGTNKSDKTRSTALVVLFGYYLDGVEQIPSEIIREACTDQGCFDSGNFAKHLKGLAEKVVMNTKAGGGYDVKLTAPGRKAAKELVEELNG